MKSTILNTQYAILVTLILTWFILPQTAQAADDTDSDGLTDIEEAQLDTLADNPDTDADGLTDGLEVKGFGSDPLKKDSDQDGLLDNVDDYPVLPKPETPQFKPMADKSIKEGQPLEFNVLAYPAQNMFLEEKKIIEWVWSEKQLKINDTTWLPPLRQQYLSEMQDRLNKGDIGALYDIQLYTKNLFNYAVYWQDYQILDDLCAIYLVAVAKNPGGSYKYLQSVDGNYTWSCSSYPSSCWLRTFQFLHIVASAINAIVDIEESQRTLNMTKLVSEFNPVINNYYKNKLDTTFNKNDRFRNMSIESPPRTILSDTDLWLIAGIVEILSAHKKAPQLVPIAEATNSTYVNALNSGIPLIESRLTVSNLEDFLGNSALGVNFDLGTRDDIEEYQYAGYLEERFPGWNATKPADPINPATNIGWDIAHATRLVSVFETLYQNRDIIRSITGRELNLSAKSAVFADTESVIRGLTNQLAYGVFNKNFHKPLFSNYMDGTRGWYRVNYDGQSNYGYGPDTLSNVIPAAGGYCFWSKYNPDMLKLNNYLWNLYKHHSHRYALKNAENKDLDIKDAITLEAWIYPEGQTSSAGYILSKANWYEGQQNWLFLLRQDNNLGIQIWDSTYPDNPNGRGWIYSTNNLTPSQNGYHVVGSFNGNELKLYVDGRNVNTTPQNGTPQDISISLAPVRLRDNDMLNDGNNRFNGKIEKVRIYNRALTDNEIWQHRNGQFHNETGLVVSQENCDFDYYNDSEVIQHISKYYIYNAKQPYQPSASRLGWGDNHMKFLASLAVNDANDNAHLVYSIEGGLPNGASFNGSTGRFSWRPTYDATGSYVINFKVTDTDKSLSNLQTVMITVENTVPGDVNEDAEISAYDAALTARVAVGLPHPDIKNPWAAEVSGDGEVTAYDAALIAQRAVGLIDRFPVEG